MSNLSIFDKKWIDLVFEGKNKDYGAYQLRKENEKTSAQAFGLGIVVLFSSVGIFTLSSFLTVNEIKKTEDEISIKIKLSNVVIPKIIENKPIVILKKVSKKFTEKTIFVNPVVAQLNNNEAVIATNKELSAISNSAPTENTTAQPTTTSIEGQNTNVVSKKLNDNILSTKNLDKQPSFPNGIDKFYTYVGNNFKTPEISDEKTVTVRVSFIVEKDGSMSNITVSNDPGYGLAVEAIRVLKTLKTKWSPGILNGESVRTAYNLPIVVKLE